MAALDMTSFDAALKQHYTPQRIEDMVYRDNPLLALMPKYKKFGGKVLPLVIKYGITQGGSHTFSDALSNKTPSKFKDFLLTRVKDYQLASIDNETLEASQGDANSFVEAATSEIDSAIHAATRSLAVAMYRKSSGSIGQIASSVTVSTAVIPLTDTESVTNFEVGMVLESSTADGGGSVKSQSRTIVGVDRDAGTLTMDSALNSGTAAWASADYLFRQGDYDLAMSGLLSWIPSSAPSNTAFFGVDRSVDVTRLGGIRFDASNLPIEEGLIAAAARAAREGAKIDRCFMNYSNFANLEKALGSKVQYINVQANAEIGFRGIVVNGPRGPIQVIADQNCPSDRAFMLQTDTWKLYSLNEPVRILEQDGLKWLRESDADSAQVRVGGYYQLGCSAPGYNVNVKLS